MNLPKKILVPTDFGEGSEAALDYAIELARTIHAQIVVMHAFEIPVVGFPDGTLVATAELASKVLEGAQQGVDKLVAEHANEGVSIVGLVKQEDATNAIVHAVQEVGAELIVMSTHGRHGIKRALLGSVAEHVVRDAPCPVLTIHPRAA